MSSHTDENQPHPSGDAHDNNTAPHYAAPHNINDFFVPDTNPSEFDSQRRQYGSGSDAEDAPVVQPATPPLSDHDDDPPTTAAFYHGHDYFGHAAGAAAPAQPQEHLQQHDDYYGSYYDHNPAQPDPFSNAETQVAHRTTTDAEVPEEEGTQEGGEDAPPAPANYGLAFAQMAGDDDDDSGAAINNNNFDAGRPRHSVGVFGNGSSGAFGETDDPSTKEANFFYVEPSVDAEEQVAPPPPPAPIAAVPKRPVVPREARAPWLPRDMPEPYKPYKEEPELPPAAAATQARVAPDPFQTEVPLPEEYVEVQKHQVRTVSAPMAEDSAPRPDRIMQPLAPDQEDEGAPDVTLSAMSALTTNPLASSDNERSLEEGASAATTLPPTASTQRGDPHDEDRVSTSSGSSPQRGPSHEEEEEEAREAEAPATTPPQPDEHAAAAALLGETAEEAAVQARAAHIAALEERMRERAHEIAVDVRQTEEEGGAGPSAEDISEDDTAAPAALPAEEEKTTTSPPDAALPLSRIVNELHQENASAPAPREEWGENTEDASHPRDADRHEGVTVNLHTEDTPGHSQGEQDEEGVEPLREAPEPPLASDSDEDHQHVEEEEPQAHQTAFDDFYYSYGDTREKEEVKAPEPTQEEEDHQEEQPVVPAAPAATTFDDLFPPAEHVAPVASYEDAVVPHETVADSHVPEEHPIPEAEPVPVNEPELPPVAESSQEEVEESHPAEVPEASQEDVPQVAEPLEVPYTEEPHPANVVSKEEEQHAQEEQLSSARTPSQSPPSEELQEEEAPKHSAHAPPVADWDNSTLDEEAKAYVAISEEQAKPTEAAPGEEARKEEELLVEQDDVPTAAYETPEHQEEQEEEEEEKDQAPIEKAQPYVEEPALIAEPVAHKTVQPLPEEEEEQPQQFPEEHVDPVVEEPQEAVEEAQPEEPSVEEAPPTVPVEEVPVTTNAHGLFPSDEEDETPVPQHHTERDWDEPPTAAHMGAPVEQFIPSHEVDYTQGWSQGVPTNADQQWAMPPQAEPRDGPVAVQVAAVSSMPLAGEPTSEGEVMYSNHLADGAVAPVPFNVATVNSMHLERHSSTEPMSGTGSQQPLYSDHLADQAAMPVAVGVSAVPSVPLASYDMPQPAVPDMSGVSHNDGWGTGAPVMDVPFQSQQQQQQQHQQQQQRQPVEHDIYVNAPPPPTAVAEMHAAPVEQFQVESEVPLQREDGKRKQRPPQLISTTYVPVTDVKVNSGNSNNNDDNYNNLNEKNDVQKDIEEEERRTVEVNSFVQKMRRQNAAPHTKKMLNSIPEFSEETTAAMAATDNSNVSNSDPNDGIFYPRHLSKLMPVYLYFSRNTIVQVLFFLMYLVVLLMSFVRLCGGGGQTCWFTFIVMLFYILDMALLFAYQQRSRLRVPPFVFRVAEPAIMFLLFLCEMIGWIIWGTTKRRSGGFVVFTFFTFVLWLAHGLTRLEQLVFGLRVLCSADRRRFQTDGFDLDLSYVHHNIIAMAWPADNFEKLFRNDVVQVADFLNRRHPQSYLVINLCSERTYNPTPFHHQTSWYPMDDHNPCELEMMVTFCHECSDFIGEDMYTRVLAIHCKGGKGRTGALISALMMYLGVKRDTKTALHHFARLRTKVGSTKFQGVQAPSQGRYVQYFEELIKLNNNNDVALRSSPLGAGSATNKGALRIPRAEVRVTRLRIMNLPHMWYSMGIGKLYFVLITKPSTDRRVHFISNSDVQFSPNVPDPSSYTKKQLRDLFGSDEENLYNACNALDPNFSDENETGVGRHGYKLDNESFWFYLNNDWSRRLDYDAFHVALRNHSMGAPPASGSSKKAQAVAEMNVSIEYKYPERIAALDGDVVLKFFYARNDPNPLESPVQVWFHTAMEQRKQQGTHFTFSREDIDGPPKDKKFKRYPEGFSIEVVLD